MRCPYRVELEAIATSLGIDPDLIEAVVWQESGAKTDAFRFERRFWDRYLKHKEEWSEQNPRRVSSSYGLMQIMYPVAKEIGFEGYPEWLFVPEIGLQWGAMKLRELLVWADWDEMAALAAYNGGKGGNKPPGPYRNATYAKQVLARRDFIKLDEQKKEVKDEQHN